jgi:hypothetical protein
LIDDASEGAPKRDGVGPGTWDRPGQDRPSDPRRGRNRRRFALLSRGATLARYLTRSCAVFSLAWWRRTLKGKALSIAREVIDSVGEK